MRIIIIAAGTMALLYALPTPAEEAEQIAATPRASIQFGAQTRRGFDRSGQYVTKEVRPDGSTAVELNGSFQNVTVARLGPGGKVETYCTTDEEDAKSWMAREDDALLRASLDAAPTGDSP